MSKEIEYQHRLYRAQRFIEDLPKIKTWIEKNKSLDGIVFVNEKISDNWSELKSIQFDDERACVDHPEFFGIFCMHFPIVLSIGIDRLRNYSKTEPKLVYDACHQLVRIIKVHHKYAVNSIRADRILRDGPRDIAGNLDVWAMQSDMVRLGFPFSFQSDLDDLVAISAAANSAKTENLDWRDYENQCVLILKSHGFRAEKTKAGADFGADIICEKGGLTYALQCKLYTKPVGIKAVQEAISARSHYRTDFAAVLAETGFTAAAKELADNSYVFLGRLATLQMLEHHH